MNKPECANCVEYKRCKEKRISWVFLVIGLLATISMRLVTVLMHYKEVYGQVAWYVAICGFFVFFLNKFRVDHERARLIEKQHLMEKISGGENIEKSDRILIGAILCAITSNKDKINYFVLFLSSGLALVAAVYFDFIRR